MHLICTQESTEIKKKLNCKFSTIQIIIIIRWPVQSCSHFAIENQTESWHSHVKKHTTDHADQAIFLFAFFSNSDLHMNKVCTPFSYYFGNIGTVSNFWTPHDIILWVI